MTVGEFIKLLEKYDPNLPLEIENTETFLGFDIDKVVEMNHPHFGSAIQIRSKELNGAIGVRL